jgi:hypothetical protein
MSTIVCPQCGNEIEPVDQYCPSCGSFINLAQVSNIVEKPNVPQQFKSMNELIEYLGTVEQRLQTLEVENRRLKTITPSKTNNVDGNLISKYVSRALPQTNLLSSSFLKRAFAVWGHFFVSNLIIGVIVGIIYACLMIVLFGSLFGSIIQNIPK